MLVVIQSIKRKKVVSQRQFACYDLATVEMDTYGIIDYKITGAAIVVEVFLIFIY